MNLDWLHPTVDRCRDLIAQRTQLRQWTKPSRHGGPDELVTELDLAVETMLIDTIHQVSPRAAIVSEESSPDPSGLEAETCFVIDPIDGTDELAAGRPGFAISIAVFHRGRPIAALVDMPAYSRRFTGVVGAGVVLDGKSVVVLSQVEDIGQARLAISGTQRRNEALEAFWDTVNVEKLVPTPGFVAKFAAVLARDCDAALYLPTNPRPAAIWDYAAAAFLLTEAGGWFGTTEGENLVNRCPFTYTGGWIAAPPALRAQLIAIAQQAPGA